MYIYNGPEINLTEWYCELGESVDTDLKSIKFDVKFNTGSHIILFFDYLKEIQNYYKIICIFYDYTNLNNIPNVYRITKNENTWSFDINENIIPYLQVVNFNNYTLDIGPDEINMTIKPNTVIDYIQQAMQLAKDENKFDTLIYG